MGGLLERVPLPTWVSEWRPDPKSPQSRFCLGPTTNTTSTTTHLPERHLTSFSTTTSIYLLEMLPSTPGQTRRKQRRRVVFILLFTCHVVANLSKLIGLGRLTLCSVSGIFNWQNRKLQFSIILILSKDADSKKIKNKPHLTLTGRLFVPPVPLLVLLTDWSHLELMEAVGWYLTTAHIGTQPLFWGQLGLTRPFNTSATIPGRESRCATTCERLWEQMRFWESSSRRQGQGFGGWDALGRNIRGK